MRRLLLALALLGTAAAATVATAQAGGRGYGGSVYVQPHVRANGSYVRPHYRSAPNGSAYDNYGTRGNVNPYTGARGSRNPW